MIYLTAAFSHYLAADDLPSAVRAALGKPLRRAAPLTQLALLGALTSLPGERRHLPTALLWQSTHGPRQETQAMLEELCAGGGEPMPFEFLATQPALAAVQIQPFVPGLRSAMHFPLDTAGLANWSLLVALAGNWLAEGRYAQVLCAHLDSTADGAVGHWLVLTSTRLKTAQAALLPTTANVLAALPDTPDFPTLVANWLTQPTASRLHLQSPDSPRLAVEFATL